MSTCPRQTVDYSHATADPASSSRFSWISFQKYPILANTLMIEPVQPWLPLLALWSANPSYVYGEEAAFQQLRLSLIRLIYSLPSPNALNFKKISSGKFHNISEIWILFIWTVLSARIATSVMIKTSHWQRGKAGKPVHLNGADFWRRFSCSSSHIGFHVFLRRLSFSYLPSLTMLWNLLGTERNSRENHKNWH